MKRFLNIAAVAALAVIALSSCNKIGTDKKAAFEYAKVTAQYSINADLDKVADVKLNYKCFDGTSMSVPVSTTKQVVDIEKYRGPIPADFTFDFSATALDNLTKASYNCSLEYEITVKVYDANGNLRKSSSAKDKIGLEVEKDMTDLIVSRINRIKKTKITIKDNMSIETTAVE